jgi:IclR family acetate operon transcriptional repressor
MSSSAKRALRVLEIIGAADRPLGVTEIARELSLPPGTVFRSLDALSRSGLIARYQASSRYIPGEASETLRRSVIASFPMREVCLPYLRQLASLSGETSALHVRLGWYAVRIACVPGAQEVSNMPPLGESCRLGESYSGCAILAFLPADEIAAYRAWAQENKFAYAPRARLRISREYGFDAEKALGDDRAAIAFPIALNNSAVASVAIEGPVVAHPVDPEALSPWREIVAEIEALAHRKPELFKNPYAHLDPATITLSD